MDREKRIQALEEKTQELAMNRKLLVATLVVNAMTLLFLLSWLLK